MIGGIDEAFGTSTLSSDVLYNYKEKLYMNKITIYQLTVQ